MSFEKPEVHWCCGENEGSVFEMSPGKYVIVEFPAGHPERVSKTEVVSRRVLMGFLTDLLLDEGEAVRFSEKTANDLADHLTIKGEVTGGISWLDHWH